MFALPFGLACLRSSFASSPCLFLHRRELSSQLVRGQVGRWTARASRPSQRCSSPGIPSRTGYISLRLPLGPPRLRRITPLAPRLGWTLCYPQPGAAPLAVLLATRLEWSLRHCWAFSCSSGYWRALQQTKVLLGSLYHVRKPSLCFACLPLY